MKNSIFRRLVLTFLIIMIPIYFLGINIYNWGINAVRNQISNSMQTQVNFFIKNLDAEIQRIKLLQYECLNDDNLNTLANISDSLNNFEKTQAILRLQQRLYAIKNSSPYIKDVSAHIPSLGLTVSSMDGAVNLRSDEMEILDKQHESSGSQIIYWKNRLFLSGIHRFMSPLNYGRPIYAISIELLNGELKQALMQQFNNDNKDYGFLLENPLQRFIISSDYNAKVTGKIKVLIEKQKNMTSNGTRTVKIGDKRYLTIYTYSKYLNMILATYLPEAVVFEPVKKYQTWFWIFSVAAIAIIVFFSFSTYKFIHKPMLTLVESFKKLEYGDLNFHIRHNHNDEFRYLFRRFNEMAESLKTLIDQVYKQKVLAQQAELKQLQSQINPHFLYNSFFILHRRIKSREYDDALRFSQQLGKYFKFITRNSSDEVLLDAEVDHARMYSDMQALFYSNRINITFDSLPEEFNHIIVPRLLVQPIIENAFEHGLKDKEGGGILSIKFNKSDTGICIAIEDNGNVINDAEIDNIHKKLTDTDDNIENTGIINIHKRLQLKFGVGSGVSVMRSGLGGLKTMITIEFKGGNENVQATGSR